MISEESRDLALICGDLGRYANARNLISQCERFLVTPEEANAIIDDMEIIVRNRWYEIARRVGVTDKDCEKLARAFAYPGFRLEIAEPV